MDEREFKRRTYKLGIRIIRLVQALPRGPVTEVIGKQLLRCGTSIGANYRAACRGRSAVEVMSKLGIVEEEADEALYGLELLVESEVMEKSRLESLMQKTSEILAITVASIKTLRGKIRLVSASCNPEFKIQNPKLQK